MQPPPWPLAPRVTATALSGGARRCRARQTSYSPGGLVQLTATARDPATPPPRSHPERTRWPLALAQ